MWCLFYHLGRMLLRYRTIEHRTIEIYLSNWLCGNINSPHDSLLYPDHISSLYLSLSLSLNLKTLIPTKIRNVSICFKNNFKIFLYSFLIFAKAVLWYNISDTLVIFTTLDLSTRRIFLQSAVLFLKNRYWENLFKVVKGSIFFPDLVLWYITLTQLTLNGRFWTIQTSPGEHFRFLTQFKSAVHSGQDNPVNI